MEGVAVYMYASKVEMFRKLVNLTNCAVFKVQVSLFPCHRQDNFFIHIFETVAMWEPNPWG